MLKRTGHRSLYGAIFALLLSSAADARGGTASQPSRFFYNDDGDRLIFLLKGPFHERQLHYPADVLVGTGVTTLVFCANIGSDVAYYPSKVASAPNWRQVENHRRNARFTYFNRLHEVGGWLRKENIDALGVVMRHAKKQGLEFIPSLRMNDGHFAQKVHPREHPLTGEFWMKNQDLIICPGKTWSRDASYEDFVLDFRHEKVRAYRLAQIYELIDGYAADGFEMDFTRHYCFFRPGHERPELITEMVRAARARLRKREKAAGKALLLIVRVPHTLAKCRQIGLDVVPWMREGLVDYVVASSPSRYFQFDISLDEFVQAAKGTACRVVASPDSWKASPAMYRAGMANYYAMGQKDTYLFNFFTARAEQREYYPLRDEDYALLRDLKSPVTLWGRPKHFMSDGWFPGRSIKLKEPGKPYDVGIYMGEDLAACRDAGILKVARLRVHISGRQSGDPVKIALNGTPLQIEQAKDEGKVIEFELRDRLPKLGRNSVSVTIEKLNSGSQPTVTLVELLTDYDLSGIQVE